MPQLKSMKVHYQLDLLPKFQNAVITTGSFDGVHLGHLHLIEQMRHTAAAIGGETVLITFDPHPRKIVSSVPGEIKQLTTIHEKIKLLDKAGVDHLVVVQFDYRFSNMTAEEYVNNFLVKYFTPQVIFIGYDHHFGNGRKGNIDLLQSIGTTNGFKVELVKEFLFDNTIVSSSTIRDFISEKDFIPANRLLGHPYSFEGFIVKGNQLGRTIGFPTANLHINDEEKIIPPNGVYAVKVCSNCTNNETYLGMMNIGVRPTVDDHKKVIEVNIFDFDKDIYEQNLCVAVFEFIRGEVKFDGLENLKAQLNKDRISAQTILQPYP